MMHQNCTENNIMLLLCPNNKQFSCDICVPTISGHFTDACQMAWNYQFSR